jgi:hypothetical protein
VPGTAAIWTDQPQYNIGDSIMTCWSIPIAGAITITDIPADGNARVIYSGPSGTGGCLPGTVTPPPGTECIRLTYPMSAGTGQTQTCFQVIGSTPPPPTTGLSISTNASAYYIGDPFTVCYHVPGPGPVTIVESLPDGRSETVLSGYDDGTGWCVSGTNVGPPGTQCMVLTYAYPGGQQISTQTCFQVYGSAPPEGWTFVGSAVIDSFGEWFFSNWIPGLAPSQTYVRVTTGACTDASSAAGVWEANLFPIQVQQPGYQAFANQLLPIGMAVNTGASGYAGMARPIGQVNPDTATWFALSGLSFYAGTPLNVCLRTP